MTLQPTCTELIHQRRQSSYNNKHKQHIQTVNTLQGGAKSLAETDAEVSPLQWEAQNKAKISGIRATWSWWCPRARVRLSHPVHGRRDLFAKHADSQESAASLYRFILEARHRYGVRTTYLCPVCRRSPASGIRRVSRFSSAIGMTSCFGPEQTLVQ